MGEGREGERRSGNIMEGKRRKWSRGGKVSRFRERDG